MKTLLLSMMMMVKKGLKALYKGDLLRLLYIQTPLLVDRQLVYIIIAGEHSLLNAGIEPWKNQQPPPRSQGPGNM